MPSDYRVSAFLQPLEAGDSAYGISLGTANAYIAIIDESGSLASVAGENQSMAFAIPEDQSPEVFVPSISKQFSDAVNSYYPFHPLKKAVVAVPAHFNLTQRESMREVWEATGLEVNALVAEPIAVALAYLRQINQLTKQTILVYDLGGSTLDTTVVDIENEVLKVAATGSIELGGRNWNDRILDLLKDEWQEATGSIEHPREELIREWGWSKAAENAKRLLTHRDETDIYVGNEHTTVHYRLTIDEFDEATKDLLDTTIEITSQTLAQAKARNSGNIDKILLAGGSCYMRQVKRALENHFKVEVEQFRPDLAASHGAAVFAARQNERINDLSDPPPYTIPVDPTKENLDLLEALMSPVTNVSSRNFGVVAVTNGLNDDPSETKYQITYLIKKNTVVPTDVIHTFVTMRDDQTSISFAIIESDADDVGDTEDIETDKSSTYGWNLPDHAKLIGSMVLYFPETTNKQNPVELRIQVSEDGSRIRVTATHGPTGHSSVLTFE